jgi:hypothetical protein
MTFARKPVKPVYRSLAHRRERQMWAGIIARVGVVDCAQDVCVMPTRAIYDGMPWHLGHTDDGRAYLGPTHVQCNVRAAAKVAAKRRSRPKRWEL